MIFRGRAGHLPGSLLLAVAIAGFTPHTAAAQGSARLSLLDVPFLSQSEALCGGAAAAMVLRYWGHAGIRPEEFAPLVRRAEGGIPTTVLAGAVRDRGYLALEVHGTAARLRTEVDAARPVIALVEDRPGTYHYMVVVGWHETAVVVHDPARAPFRVMTRSEFEQRWHKAGAWALIVLPASGETSQQTPASLAATAPATGDPACGRLVQDGVTLAQHSDLAEAERTLAEAVLRCPGASARRELAGVRLLQRRWQEVRELATESLRLEPDDPYAQRLLATGTFLDGDAAGALAAWNALGEPVIDLVTIDGLVRTRHRVVERLLGLDTGGVLTPSDWQRTSRRLGELPSANSSRVEYAPVSGGRAEVRAYVAEQPVAPRGWAALAALGVRAAASREASLDLASPTGGGEVLTARWRFWPNRPRYAVSASAPAPGLEGAVWSVEGVVERQPFTAVFPESRRRGVHAAIAQWANGAVRWDARVGADRWDQEGMSARIGGGVRIASRSDAARLDVQFDRWSGASTFTVSTIGASWRSSAAREGVVTVARGGYETSSRRTPLSLWRAGDTGDARDTWLRAHPVLNEGSLRPERLGRAVLNGSLEVQRWWPIGPVKTAAVTFLDAAATARRVTGGTVRDVDAGIGVRVALPGTRGILRVDAAHGLRDGHRAVSAGWVQGW